MGAVLSSRTALATTPTSHNYLATYENGSNSVNTLTPYQGLSYGTWNFGPYDEQAGDCAYVCAQSFPVEIAFHAGPGASANITSDYKGSNVTHFTLNDFYFGCNGYFTNATDSTGKAIGPYESPVNCTLSISAYTSPSKAAVAKQTFNYKPDVQYNRNTGAPKANMGHYTFSSAFRAAGIKYVTFSATGPASGYAKAADGSEQGPLAQTVPDVLFDSFNYTVYYT